MSLKLYSERLVLRSFIAQDVPIFAAYRSLPEVAAYQGWTTPYTIDEAQRFYESLKGSKPAIPGSWYQIAVERQSDGQMIGDCALHRLGEDPEQAEIGFTFAPDYQGQGYATEAVTRLLQYCFETVNLHRVRAICDVENTPSYRLLERLGMRREAHFIEHYWFKGRWASEYWYAILRREWEARKEHRP